MSPAGRLPPLLPRRAPAPPGGEAPRFGRQGSARGRERGEGQAHVPDAQLAAAKAAEVGGPLGAAGRPSAVLDEKWVLHVDVHQLLGNGREFTDEIGQTGMGGGGGWTV